MFFKKSSAKKLQKNMLSSAEKVWKYRGDIFTEEENEVFKKNTEALKNAVSDDEISTASEKLDETLKSLGGTIYPNKTIPEWVELIIVAAVLAGGIRAFFIQPFKIPTNSMFPTYNGMTAEVYFGEISPVQKAFEKVFRSASFYDFSAPVSGEVSVAFSKTERVGDTDLFKIMIGDSVMDLPLPRDFSIDSVLIQRFFPDIYSDKQLSLAEKRSAIFHRVQSGKLGRKYMPGSNMVFIKTGVSVSAGDSFLKFKIYGGDMVLVDRMSYHFKKPEVGDPFVFRTHNIAGLDNKKLYYIKRLAGTPGDTLQVKDGQLLRNRELITGSAAFNKNNFHDIMAGYYGYLPSAGSAGAYSKPLDMLFTVPANSYYALGDNSSNSYDSRGWGCVPADDAVGKALFVLYPFSSHWGIAE